jgi:hypothetical protein
VFEQKSAPAHVMTTVNGHFHDNSTFVTTHMYKVKNKKHKNKKESKTYSKKKTGTAKHGAFAKIDDNCKNIGDTQFAQSDHLQQLMNLARGIET